MTDALANTTPSTPAYSEGVEIFELAQRQAKALSKSTMIPTQYQGNMPNCMIALELASRIGCSPFAIMQNVDIIHGTPSMRAKFLIACVNACGRFEPIRFRWEGEPIQGCPGSGCRAYATERSSGEECLGVLITWKMAVDEKWVGKTGSKWKTMPELMFMYRAAAFWQRIYAPELSLGMSTREEAMDMAAGTVSAAPRSTSSLGRKLEEAQALTESIEVEVAPTREPTPEPIPIGPDGPEPYVTPDGGYVQTDEPL